MSLEVLEPGLLLTVQDLGRPGHEHLGVPRGGAADPRSRGAAQRLVGNEPGAAGGV
jgi:allophanate hydrolase subunit 2